MIGNVWEWVDDYWGTQHAATPRGAPPLRDPRGPRTTGERTKKGGSYMCHKSYCWRYRVCARTKMTPDSSAHNVGFRCAAPATDPVVAHYSTVDDDPAATANVPLQTPQINV